MTDQVQDVQETQPQEPIAINLSLNLDQVNFILNALGKLPTETGAWIVRNVVGQQAQQQVNDLQSSANTDTDSTPA